MIPHEHVFDVPTMFCSYCGLPAEAIAAGRDKPATWDDVDNAYKAGWAQGLQFARVEFRRTRRRKLIEVGAYLQLRYMKSKLR